MRVLAAAVALSLIAGAAHAQPKVLRYAPAADLTLLDPMVVTALVTADQNTRSEWLRSWRSGAPNDLIGDGYALVGYVGHFDEDPPPRAGRWHHAAIRLRSSRPTG